MLKYVQLEDLYELALQNMEQAQLRQERGYNKRRRVMDLQVGTMVLLKTHTISSKQNKFSAKLAMGWQGPYRIVQRTSLVNYIIADPLTGQGRGTHHIANLRPYLARQDDGASEQVLTDTPNTSSELNDTVYSPSNAPGHQTVVPHSNSECHDCPEIIAQDDSVRESPLPERRLRPHKKVDYAKFHRTGYK
ncbi:UNVERIFIED_CONTAM: hypothetical protein FKN15_007508 [Acipenser sinensis]